MSRSSRPGIGPATRYERLTDVADGTDARSAASVRCVSRTRTERLVNLVICLLSTRRFLTAGPDRRHRARLRARPGGRARPRGVPAQVRAGQGRAARARRAAGDRHAQRFDNEPGYRIARRDYALPDITLAPDEAAAVGIAARLWQHAGLAEAASSGLAKLRAAGVEVDPHATLGVEPVVTVDAGVRAAHRRRPRPAGGHVRLPRARERRRQRPPAAAVGRRLLARPVVRGRPRPRPRRRALFPAVPDRQRRPAGRAGAGATSRRSVDLIAYVAQIQRAGRAHLPRHRPDAAGPRGRHAPLGRDVVPGPDGDRLMLRYADVDVLRRLAGRTAPTSSCSTRRECATPSSKRLKGSSPRRPTTTPRRGSR